MCSTKLILFVVSKDKWNTKEDTGKAMKNHCTYCGMLKGTSRAEAMSNSEKIKSIPLAIVKLCLKAGRQLL